MTQMPPPLQPGHTNFGGAMRPHRGTLVLVLGILGLVLCVICGILAWVFGNEDIKAMDSGQMDPTGRGMTQAGKICGMISVILNVVIIGFYIIMVLVVGAAAVGGAATNP